MKRVSILLAATSAALALAPAAAGDARSVSDPKGDPKGSYYPGAGYVWTTSGPCAGSWQETATGACVNEGEYTENAGIMLDIASVRHSHRNGRLVHRLSLHARWRNALLSAGAELSFYLSTDRDSAFERRVDVILRDGKLASVVRNARGRIVARGKATRPSQRAVEAVFERRALGRGVKTYRWLAFAGIACKRKYNACGDRAPGTKLVVHRLG